MDIDWVCGVPGNANDTLVELAVYVELEDPLTFNVTGITVCDPPLPGVIVIDPVWLLVMPVVLANTLRVAGLLTVTLLVFCVTNSQEVLFVGVVVKVNEIGVVLDVDSEIVVER